VSTSPARLLSAIAGRSGAASVVAGPPGAGKSALLDDLERRARAAGWRARRAAHAPNRRFVPYGALRDLFDPHPALLVVLATRPRTGHEPDVATIFGAIEGVEAIRVQRADRPAAA
jgi:hypothetical protein